MRSKLAVGSAQPHPNAALGLPKAVLTERDDAWATDLCVRAVFGELPGNWILCGDPFSWSLRRFVEAAGRAAYTACSPPAGRGGSLLVDHAAVCVGRFTDAVPRSGPALHTIAG